MSTAVRRIPGRFGRLEWVLAGLAVAWGLALPFGAVFAPLYSGLTQTSTVSPSGESVTTTVESTATLVEVNGWWVVAYAVLPLLVAVIVVGLLWTFGDWRVARVVAMVVLAGLAAFNVLAMASIGFFLLPVTLLLLGLAVARSVRA